MNIRPEQPQDYAAVHLVNETAFKTSAEANLVDILRKEAQPIVSLIAEELNIVVGHILFSPVTIADHPDCKIMGLGPMAVSPEQQRKGIGTALIHSGLEECKRLAYGAVVVLGHAGYYPRYGFVPAIQFGIPCEYDVPPEVFMVIELQPGYLQDVHGIVKYHPAINTI